LAIQSRPVEEFLKASFRSQSIKIEVRFGMIRREDAVPILRGWFSGGVTVLCRSSLMGARLEMESTVGSLTDKELVLVSGGATLALRLDLTGEEFEYRERKDSPAPILPGEETETGLVILFPPRGLTRDGFILVPTE
jgi:hypothetical protein